MRQSANRHKARHKGRRWSTVPSDRATDRSLLIPAMTYSTTQAGFAATLATIRTELTELAYALDKPERTVAMRAAAALALFESDTLRKAAGPLLPGEQA